MPAKHLLAAISVVLLPALARADAPNPSFYLVNRSDQAINQMYASPATAAGWGRDQLGDDTVDPGGYAPIRLHADGNCTFDLRIVYSDGRSEERRGINTCVVDNISFGETRPPAAPSSSESARDPSFRIVNRGKREIEQVYVRLAGAVGWGQDRLGDDTVDADETKVITLAPGKCLWDVRFVFKGGRSLEKRRLNLCDVSDLRVP